MYTVALAYLGERVKISELAIYTSFFIIIYESGGFLGPIIVGQSMNSFGNEGFIYSIIIFTFIPILLGIIRSVIKKNYEI